MLITSDEARHTFDRDWCYVVIPEHPFWGARATPDTKRVAEDFHYSSDSNTEWLSVDDLRDLLARWPAEAPADLGG